VLVQAWQSESVVQATAAAMPANAIRGAMEMKKRMVELWVGLEDESSDVSQAPLEWFLYSLGITISLQSIRH